MTDEKKPQQEKPTEAINPELQELQDIFNTVGRPILIAVLVVLVGLLVVNKVRKSSAAAEQEAARLLTSGRSQADLETVINDYAKTKAAPQAMLALAKLHYRQGQYLPAIEQYETFIATYPENEQVIAAQLGKLLCQKAQTPSAETAAALLTFATANPDSYLTPQALLAHARCLVAIGQRDEARTVLEDMTKTYEENGWGSVAEEELTQLKKAAEREANPMPVPEVVVDDGTGEIPAPMFAIPGPADAPAPTPEVAPAPEATPTPVPEGTPEAEAAPAPGPPATEAAPAPEAKPAPEPKPVPEAAPTAEAKPAVEAVPPAPEATPTPVPEATPEAEAAPAPGPPATEAAPAPEAKPAPEPKPVPEAAPTAEAKPAVEAVPPAPEATPTPVPEATPEAEAAPAPGPPATEAAPAPEAKPAPEPKPVPEAAPTAEVKPAVEAVPPSPEAEQDEAPEAAAMPVTN